MPSSFSSRGGRPVPSAALREASKSVADPMIVQGMLFKGAFNLIEMGLQAGEFDPNINVSAHARV